MYFTGFELVDHNLKNAVGKLPERKYKLGVVGSQQIPFLGISEQKTGEAWERGYNFTLNTGLY